MARAPPPKKSTPLDWALGRGKSVCRERRGGRRRDPACAGARGGGRRRDPGRRGPRRRTWAGGAAARRRRTAAAPRSWTCRVVHRPLAARPRTCRVVRRPLVARPRTCRLVHRPLGAWSCRRKRPSPAAQRGARRSREAPRAATVAGGPVGCPPEDRRRSGGRAGARGGRHGAWKACARTAIRPRCATLHIEEGAVRGRGTTLRDFRRPGRRPRPGLSGSGGHFVDPTPTGGGREDPGEANDGEREGGIGRRGAADRV
jgi:hypothetical protein